MEPVIIFLFAFFIGFLCGKFGKPELNIEHEFEVKSDGKKD